MHSETIYPKTKQVLDILKHRPILSKFYLAGGTGLALQLGHRKSIDLDFFSDKYPGRELVLSDLESFSPTITQENPGTIDLIINDVKVSFLEYKYPLLADLASWEEIRIADVIDIACMKLSAISSRGSKKDFVDLYFILQRYSLEEIFMKFEKKFEGVNYQKLHLLKSIVFFDDADGDPDPVFTSDASWEEIKRKIEEEVKKFRDKYH